MGVVLVAEDAGVEPRDLRRFHQVADRECRSPCLDRDRPGKGIPASARRASSRWCANSATHCSSASTSVEADDGSAHSIPKRSAPVARVRPRTAILTDCSTGMAQMVLTEFDVRSRGSASHLDLRQETPRVPIDRQGEPENPAGMGTINCAGSSRWGFRAPTAAFTLQGYVSKFNPKSRLASDGS
jgi:hypothetical protein